MAFSAMTGAANLQIFEPDMEQFDAMGKEYAGTKYDMYLGKAGYLAWGTYGMLAVGNFTYYADSWYQRYNMRKYAGDIILKSWFGLASLMKDVSMVVGWFLVGFMWCLTFLPGSEVHEAFMYVAVATAAITIFRVGGLSILYALTIIGDGYDSKRYYRSGVGYYDYQADLSSILVERTENHREHGWDHNNADITLELMSITAQLFAMPVYMFAVQENIIKRRESMRAADEYSEMT